MNRAPIAAWQGLFAAGGAPAASHVALARVPVREKLLAPLAGSTLVREGGFDALVRPLELGGVLGKRIARADAPRDAVDGGDEAGDGSDSRGDYPHAAAGGTRRSVALLNDESSREGSGATGRRRPLAPREPSVSRRGDAPRLADRGLPRIVAAPGSRAVATRSIRSTDALAHTPFARQRASFAIHTSEATEGAARTPVVVTAPSPSVARLLHAVSAPTPSDETRRGPALADSVALSNGSASSALERVLARIGLRGGAPGTTGSVVRSDRASGMRAATDASERGGNGHALAPLDGTRPTSRVQRQLSAPTAGADTASGGFRGLASRALKQSESALPAVSSPSPRLSHEVRTISDLPLDALDASVAESVTRILQREARRHGIDLAGSGT